MNKRSKWLRRLSWLLLALLIAPIQSHANPSIPSNVPEMRPAALPALLSPIIQREFNRFRALHYQAKVKLEDQHAVAAAGEPQTAAGNVTASAIAQSAQTEPHELYETTAYFLNVREKPSSKAAILRVVEKGTPLQVVQKTDNGWLKLLGDGYVHGNYAKRMPADSASAVSLQMEAEHRDSDPSAEGKTPASRRTDQQKNNEPPAQPSFAVHVESGLTEAHIETVLKGTALEGESLAPAILEIEEKYGINALFTIAVMKLESGNGKSRLAKTKNNLFGLNATGGNNSKAYSFETKADSVRKFGQLIADHYVGKGYTTIEKIGGKYCPANEDWPRLVKQIMKSDHRKIIKSGKL